MGEGQNTAGGDSVKDQSIIELFIERSEAAIEETKLKFGRLIYSIAYHIVQDRMDAEECESDTYLSAWNTIPPALPENLKAYLLRIARNLALKQYRHEHTAKRDKRMQVSLDELETKIPELLKDIQANLLQKATERRDSKTYVAHNMEEFEKEINETPGFIKAMWCGDQACEDAIKEKTAATSRCIPFEQEEIDSVCVCCGKPAKHMVYWGRAY